MDEVETARDGAAPVVAAFPVPGWDRYVPVRLLGQGGMGKVFLAIDRRLHREVAIKFVHGDDPEHVRRLIGEARAQARVRHDRVCQVHEVGEVDGKVYIAMQYIAGAPLGSVAGELTVEQKVMLVRGAAEGIHAAHRAGIIHRDVKPSNILVAAGADGALAATIVDFGLARTVHEVGATRSGAVMGTPRYMAPEQARGAASTLDRRADVYSLGATLYHLVTGEPPTPGEGLAEVVQRLLAEEPRRARAVNSDVPEELDAIVMKCLEKDRAARYDSARALAEDLGRFLDGEPVLARAHGAWYRARKWIARRKRLVAAAAVVLVALGVAIGWGVAARRAADARERFARRFTERVERIEAMARYSALAPAHDVRPDRAALRAQMAALAADVADAGDVAAGPGHYALGRGALALDDDETARTELLRAWRGGFREPRVAYALALALGHLYQHAQREARLIEREVQRDAALLVAQLAYRDPALVYLAASAGADVPSAAYVTALGAFYEERFGDALHALDSIGDGLAWFYEARALRGEILLARASKESGQRDHANADADLARGRAACAAATSVGESVPAIYQAIADLEYIEMFEELYGGGDIMAAFTRTVAATGRALALDPDRYDALVTDARAHRSLAEWQAQRGEPTDAAIAHAIAELERAIQLAPARHEARLELALAERQRGEVLQAANRDPGPALGRAIEIAKTIAPAARDSQYHGLVGLVYKVWADYEDQVGRASAEHRGAAIAEYELALVIDPSAVDVRINLGVNYLNRATQPRAATPEADLALALLALAHATQLDPKHVVPYFYAGEVHEALAERARRGGGDPDPYLARAVAAYTAGLAIDPELPHLYNGLGIARLDQARAAWLRGEDPEPRFTEARAAFDRAIAVAPDQAFAYDNVGELLAMRAGVQRARGEDPSATARAAAAALEQAIARIPDHPTFWANFALAHELIASAALARTGDPGPSLARATAAVDRALAINAKELQAHRTHAALLWLAARRGPFAARAYDAAAAAFDAALALAPEEPEVRLEAARFALGRAEAERAAGLDSSASRARARALVDPLAVMWPDWPDVRAIRGRL